MSYEIRYFPAFIFNLEIWFAKKYNKARLLKSAYNHKIQYITRFLEKEFKPIYQKYDKSDFQLHETSIPNIVWILWWQGESEMPSLVKACVDSIRKHSLNYEIRIVTKENYKNYLDVSDVIGFRENNRMSIQYFSDIIRARLLSKYGGIWLDATMFITNESVFKQAELNSFYTVKLNLLLDNNLLFSPCKGQFCLSFWASPPIILFSHI